MHGALLRMAMVSIVAAVNESNESDPNSDFYEMNSTQPMLLPCTRRPAEIYQSAAVHDPGPASLGEPALETDVWHCGWLSGEEMILSLIVRLLYISYLHYHRRRPRRHCNYS